MPLRKFDLLSLVGGRKNKHEASPQPDAVSSHSHQSNRRLAPSSLHTSNASYRSSHNVFQSNFRSSYSTSDVPPPAPAPSRDGFYSSVQYQRLTSLPTINQRPPSSASSIQYERLSIPQVPVKYEPSTVSTASNTLFPSPTYEYVSQLILTAESPVQVPPPLQPTPPAPADSSILSLLSPAEESVPVRTRTSQSPRSIGNVVKDRTASREETSPPFSIVMEEWMSQLRTPTPDVTLLPSPYDFNQNTPTPVEKMEDIRHIHDALLPTPPPDMHDQKQGTKSNQYISSANRRGHPLMEDVASICRDLIPQDVADQVTKRILTSIANAQGGDPATAAAATLAVAQMSKASYNKEPMSSFRNQVNLPSPPIDGEEDEGGGGEGGGKGKRRKMCTADGCQNLSRSRGLCKAHGGGRRCSVEGCTRASQSGSLCITHGGGKRCTVHGCQKAAQSRGMCKAHGGGVRCRIDGCTKSSQGDGFCRTHGGGRRCGYPEGCTKWAQRNGMCMAHSEGRYGNSYRGRLARMQGMEGNEDDHDGEDDDEDV